MSAVSVADVTIDGGHALRVRYNATDGGENDEDLDANGIIVDPVAVGLAIPQAVTTTTVVVTAPATSAAGTLPTTGSNSLNMVYIALAALGLGAAIVFVLQSLRKTRTI